MNPLHQLISLSNLFILFNLNKILTHNDFAYIHMQLNILKYNHAPFRIDILPFKNTAII